MKVHTVMGRIVCASVFGLLVFAAMATPATAQNLLANPGFNASLGNWSAYGTANASEGGSAYASADQPGSPLSGSVALNLLAPAAVGVQVGVAQCVLVTPGQTYTYGARFLQPLANTAGSVRAMVDVAFFSDAACATPQNLGEEQGAVLGVAYPLDDAAWRAIPGSVPVSPASVLAPAAAASAQFRVLIERRTGTAPAQVNFDSVFFGVNLTPVQLQTFSVD